MPPVRPSILAATLLGLALAGPAHALSCDEVVAMVKVNVPVVIVVQTIDDSGGLYTPEDIECLVRAEVPEPVLNAARALQPDAEGPEVHPLPDEAQSEPTSLGDGLLQASGTSQRAAPEEISRVIKLIDAHKPLSASLILADLLAEDSYPERRGQLHYHLACSLQDLDMLHSARHHYLEVVARGPSDPWFDHALRRLVRLADQTDDMTDLKRVVAKIPADSWPRDAQPTLAYLQGLRSVEQDEIRSALISLGQVPTHSAHGLQARYLEGVIHNRTGRARSAVRAFQEVIQTEVQASSREQARRHRELKNLALMDVARVHYGLQLFDRAETLYTQVETASEAWPTARLELAWAQFMQNDTGGSLGQILTVRSPYFAAQPFMPEADVLRALNHFTLCEYDEVERIALDFEARMQPVQQELQAFARSYASAEGRKLSDQAWATYFEDFPAHSVLGPEIFDHLLRDRDLAAQVTRLQGLDRELELIGQQKARWSDSMEPRLQPVLDAERERTRRRAGLLLLSGAAELSIELRDLLAQSEIILFEANDAVRTEIETIISHHEDGRLRDLAEAEIPYATSAGEAYWPFNGEFWQDELGWYVYVGESMCR